MSIHQLKVIAMDLDGTITDGNYYVNENGGLFKNFNTKDMHAIYRASQNGFKVVIVTGATDHVVYAKLGRWGYKIISGSKDKVADLGNYLAENHYSWVDVAFIGDGENDYKVMQKAAFSACPSNAIPELLEDVSYVASAKGGEGAVYEIIRHIHKLRNIDWVLE